MNTAAVVFCVIAAWFAGAVVAGLVVGRMVRNRDKQLPRPEGQRSRSSDHGRPRSASSRQREGRRRS